jgi:hypothetical protein
MKEVAGDGEVVTAAARLAVGAVRSIRISGPVFKVAGPVFPATSAMESADCLKTTFPAEQPVMVTVMVLPTTYGLNTQPVAAGAVAAFAKSAAVTDAGFSSSSVTIV